jgi:hypothetical protein
MEEKMLELSAMAEAIHEYYYRINNHLSVESDKYAEAFKKAMYLSEEDVEILEKFIEERSKDGR